MSTWKVPGAPNSVSTIPKTSKPSNQQEGEGSTGSSVWLYCSSHNPALWTTDGAVSRQRHLWGISLQNQFAAPRLKSPQEENFMQLSDKAQNNTKQGKSNPQDTLAPKRIRLYLCSSFPSSWPCIWQLLKSQEMKPKMKLGISGLSRLDLTIAWRVCAPGSL
jgi:hypothetical protein